METVVMNLSGEFEKFSNSPDKNWMRNQRKSYSNNRPLISHPSNSFALANLFAGGCYGGGLLCAPPNPSLSNSFPPSGLVFRPQQNLHPSRQPPLLPLPVSFAPINRSNSSACNYNSRLSSPPINKKIKNRARDHSLTPKKSKNQKKDLKKVEDPLPQPEKKEPEPPKKFPAVESTDMMGPDPKDLPKDVVSRVLPSSSSSISVNVSGVDRFSGSAIFTISPPPSSLPLPTFSLRPKLSCKAEAAAGVDAGATDNLRRILRLR